jgi:peptidoglycan/LPS O-acetylase OafA/YrhL
MIGRNTGTHWDVSLPVTSKDIFTHLILIQDFFKDTAPKINHSFWSISVEWRIYFLFPLIILAWQRFGALATVAAAICISYFILFFLKFSSLNTSPWGICPHYIGLFTLGMLAAEISYTDGLLSRLRNKLQWELITTCTAIIALAIYVLLWKTSWWSITDLMAGVCASCLLISLASNKLSVLLKILSWQPLVFIGTFAYSLYLMHAPLLQVMWEYVVVPLSLADAPIFIPFLIMLLPSVVTSYLFFLVCERPFLRKSTK